MSATKRTEAEFFDCSLGRQEITREVERLTWECRMSDVASTKYRFEEYRNEIGREMVMRLIAHIATKKFDSKTVIFPANWWQSFKKRWLPSWALKHWPVKHTQITFEATAYHPDIEIPDHATFVRVMMRTELR